MSVALCLIAIAVGIGILRVMLDPRPQLRESGFDPQSDGSDGFGLWQITEKGKG